MIKEDEVTKVEERREHEKHVKVKLVWGGTGESKEAEVKLEETAGQVFELIYHRFHQQKSDQDTFEVDGKDFPRARFGETVKSLIRQHGEHGPDDEHGQHNEHGHHLEFEVIPPTSGA
jgi:hypothetical protein